MRTLAKPGSRQRNHTLTPALGHCTGGRVGSKEKTVMSQRNDECIRIRQAYACAAAALLEASRAINGVEVATYFWQSDHRAALLGMRKTLTIMAIAVPDYSRDDAERTT